MSAETLNLVMQFLSSISEGKPLSPSVVLPYLQKQEDKSTVYNFLRNTI